MSCDALLSDTQLSNVVYLGYVKVEYSLRCGLDFINGIDHRLLLVADAHLTRWTLVQQCHVDRNIRQRELLHKRTINYLYSFG